MLDALRIVDGLARNQGVFARLLAGRTPAEQTWRPSPEKWSRLEIVCHLRDEEVDDFRRRVRHTLAGNQEQPPSVDPVDWVTSRHYADQDYEATLAAFLAERETSLRWLRGLASPHWDSGFHHPKLGLLTARLFLVNWLAHDALHLRQIVRYDYQTLEREGGADLEYAGKW